MSSLMRSGALARVMTKHHHFSLQRTATAGFASKAVSATLLRKPVDGKNVIVTGSARGIGKSIALRLASDGYNVCVNDIGANSKECEEVVEEIRSLGRKACAAIADVSNRGEVKDMIQKSVEELGPLHTMYGHLGSSMVTVSPLSSSLTMAG